MIRRKNRRYVPLTLLALLYLGCASTPMVEPEVMEESAPAEAPAKGELQRRMDEGGIGGTGNGQCSDENQTRQCQEPRP